MQEHRGSKFIWFLLFACITSPISLAASADSKLLSLIPPGAQAVARISSRSGDSRSDYVLMKRSNRIDFNDFLALSGVDRTLVARELIFVAAPDDKGELNEHSLLIRGSFDRESIYASAMNLGAGITRYGGHSVLVVQPLVRERDEFKEIRWLAIPALDLMLFGSITSVQRELDRYQSRSEADPALVARLAHLRACDETWTVLSPVKWAPDLRDALTAIDPVLAKELKDGDSLQFGIHYGKRIEFEYEITTASPEVAHIIPASFSKSLAGLGRGVVSLLPSNSVPKGNTVRGIVKVSTARYNAWLIEVSTRNRVRNSTPH